MTDEELQLRERARYLTQKAIKEGKLIKGPCEVCRTTKKIHAHHDDYSKPLAVRWLCAHHHGREHSKVSAVALEKWIEDSDKRWQRLDDLPFSRGFYYDHVRKNPEIVSVTMKPGSGKGIILIDSDSLDAYLEKLAVQQAGEGA